METKTYTFIDKSSWGDGQWQNEPDKVQWQDEETGLPCLAVRHHTSGHWCGYVGVDETHVLSGVRYSQSFTDNEDNWRNSPDGIFEVHGGLTFSEFCQEDEKEHGICHIPALGESDKAWWFGFDCAHAGDMSPGQNALSGGFGFKNQDTYKTLEYVKSQCRELAKQLKSFSGVTTVTASPVEN